MSSTPMTYVFSHSEYETRCNEAKAFYLGNIEQLQSPNTKGALVETVVTGLTAGAERYTELRKQGYTPLPPESALESFSLAGPGVVVLYLFKSAKQQQMDLEKIYKKVREDYVLQLEQEYELEVTRQIDFAIAAAERKELESKAEAQRVIAEQVRQDMLASRVAVRQKLIASGRLNEDGEAL